jgi:hypothetical protein
MRRPASQVRLTICPLRCWILKFSRVDRIGAYRPAILLSNGGAGVGSTRGLAIVLLRTGRRVHLCRNTRATNVSFEVEEHGSPKAGGATYRGSEVVVLYAETSVGLSVENSWKPSQISGNARSHINKRL